MYAIFLKSMGAGGCQDGGHGGHEYGRHVGHGHVDMDMVDTDMVDMDNFQCDFSHNNWSILKFVILYSKGFE